MRKKKRHFSPQPRIRVDASISPEPSPGPKPYRIPRTDGLVNEYLGIGNDRDKVAAGYFAPFLRLDDMQIYAMFYGDGLCAKGCSARPFECFRAGYTLTAENEDLAADLVKKAKKLDFDRKCRLAMTWANAWGGSLLVIGANDGQAFDQPLNIERVRSVDWINVVDRRYAPVTKYQDNPALPNAGEAEVYQIVSTSGAIAHVHASRVIRFDGVPETDPLTRRQLGGYTYSALQRPYETLIKFATAFAASGTLISDASQGVLKLHGLLDAISSGSADVMTRLALLDMNRSSGRALALDAETEDFERKPTTFAGVPDILDRFMMRISADFETPVSILFGRSPQGLNATGESDFRTFYGSIAAEQETRVKPEMLRFYAILGASEDLDLEIEFNALWEPSDKEKAETDFIVAQKDALYIDKTVLIPEQVTLARFGSGNGAIQIDEDAIEKSLAQEIKLSVDPANVKATSAHVAPKMPDALAENANEPQPDALDKSKDPGNISGNDVA